MNQDTSHTPHVDDLDPLLATMREGLTRIQLARTVHPNDFIFPGDWEAILLVRLNPAITKRQKDGIKAHVAAFLEWVRAFPMRGGA